MSITLSAPQSFTGEFPDGALIQNKWSIYRKRRTDIWRARIGSKEVALRGFRTDSMTEKALKEFKEEIHNLSWMNHPNILPFLGVVRDTNSDNPRCIVSPWQLNGDILCYVQWAEPPTLVRLHLLTRASKGLVFLHEIDMAHGYLKPTHILVSDDTDALICDMGATEADERTAADRETCWLAPEALGSALLQVRLELSDEQACDVYSFGMIMYACLAGFKPFAELKTSALMYAKIYKGTKPRRESDEWRQKWKKNWCTDEMWNLMMRCWSTNPKERPSMKEVHKELETIERREMTLEYMLSSTCCI
ncbi:hypothetical protein QCA50_007862 [Cerrena zonata]|uniref:Protein kinase domain-containing protein n=1 Tax=Cerrena zonata TaxID=2478898 RepID=A0AAW0G8T7_9APHY